MANMLLRQCLLSTLTYVYLVSAESLQAMTPYSNEHTRHQSLVPKYYSPLKGTQGKRLTPGLGKGKHPWACKVS